MELMQIPEFKFANACRFVRYITICFQFHCVFDEGASTEDKNDEHETDWMETFFYEIYYRVISYWKENWHEDCNFNFSKFHVIFSANKGGITSP